MTRSRIVVVVILSIMLLTGMMPQLASAAFNPATDRPLNLAPYDNATEIGPAFVFEFSYPDPTPEKAIGKQVQWRADDGNYTTPLFDSGWVVITTDTVYPEGLFAYGQKYHWRVRVQDELGYWTQWSNETAFTVIKNLPPSQPENWEPNDNATAVSLPVTLQASDFRDPNAGELVLGEKDTHAASQWQITATSGNYTSPVIGGSRTASTIAFVAATKKITDSANGLAIFKTGDTIAITGSTSNNGIYTVSQGNVAGEIVVSGSLKDESAGASVSINNVTTTNLTSITVPLGKLSESTTYYWHVRYQDSYGNWSAYSSQTLFTAGTTAVSDAVNKPVNGSPYNGATEISPDQKLTASVFEGGAGRTHYASRWQVAASGANQKNTDGSYQQALYDSSVDAKNLVDTFLPARLEDYGKTYYWHVKYQDDTGAWSAWSDETSFTVVKNLAPGQPANVAPLDGAKDVAVPMVLQATDFSDADVSVYVALTDSQAASQWQVTDSAGVYTSTVWDSGVAAASTSTTVPKGTLLAGAKYYWHIRYQDSYGNWSAWSAETSFTTKAILAPVALFSADKTEVVAGQELVTFSDNSTPMAEIDRWAWDFGDNTGENWTSDTRPPNGEAFHNYTQAGSYTVKLTVYNGAKPGGVQTSLSVVVHAKPEAVFTLTPAAAQVGTEITLTDGSTPTADITSWEWQFDDGTTVLWTKADRDAAGGQLKHAFKKSDTHTVTLIVKGPLGESYYNKQVNVTGGGGFHFGLWMIGVGVAVVVVVAGLAYLLRARRAK